MQQQACSQVVRVRFKSFTLTCVFLWKKKQLVKILMGLLNSRNVAVTVSVILLYLYLLSVTVLLLQRV